MLARGRARSSVTTDREPWESARARWRGETFMRVGLAGVPCVLVAGCNCHPPPSHNESTALRSHGGNALSLTLVAATAFLLW